MLLEGFMLFNGVDDGYGGTMYMPTTLGYLCLVIAMVAILIVAAFLFGKKDAVVSTKQLTVSALCIGLAFVLSNIKIVKMPMGGSVTLLSMMFIALIGYWYGLRAAITLVILSLPQVKKALNTVKNKVLS